MRADMTQSNALPEITVVIIGLNAARDIGPCIEAIRASDYPRDKLELIYADGGSTDGSVDLATAYPGVRVVQLTDPHPSPGRGRNAGLRASTRPLVQLVDSDSYLDAGWLRAAVGYLEDDVAAVTGALFERRPDANIYHRVVDWDWRIAANGETAVKSPSATLVFGGNVLVRREALVAAGGYDEALVVGEEADLSHRVRHAGWRILEVPDTMATHDIRMGSLRAYLRRAMRSGYAYAATAMRFRKTEEKLFLQRLARIVVSGCAPLVVLLLGIALGYGLVGLGVALLLAFRSLRKVPRWVRRDGLRLADAMAYGSHLSFVIYPQLFGVARYFAGRLLGRPLRNARPRRAPAGRKGH
jgi:GT2 family glycosyltransferase